MGVKFNFNAKDIEKKIKKAANDKLSKGVEISCPKCSKKTKVSTTRAIKCTGCGTTIKLNSRI